MAAAVGRGFTSCFIWTAENKVKPGSLLVKLKSKSLQIFFQTIFSPKTCTRLKLSFKNSLKNK